MRASAASGRRGGRRAGKGEFCAACEILLCSLSHSHNIECPIPNITSTKHPSTKCAINTPNLRLLIATIKRQGVVCYFDAAAHSKCDLGTLSRHIRDLTTSKIEGHFFY